MVRESRHDNSRLHFIDTGQSSIDIPAFDVALYRYFLGFLRLGLLPSVQDVVRGLGETILGFLLFVFLSLFFRLLRFTFKSDLRVPNIDPFGLLKRCWVYLKEWR